MILYRKDVFTGEWESPDYSLFVEKDNDFELIEEDTINIEDIKEVEDLFEKHNADIDDKLCIQQNRRLINKLIRCIKQLNKEIKELNKNYCCNCGVELTEENKALEDICNECKYGEE